MFPSVKPPTIGGLDPRLTTPTFPTTPPPAASPGILGQVNKFVGSPLGQMGLGLLGGALQSSGDTARQQASLQSQEQQQFLAALAALQRQREDEDYQRQVQSQRPLGEARDYAEKVLMRPFMMSLMQQQASQRPGNPAIAKAMGRGFQMPQLSPELQRLWTSEAVGSELANDERQRAAMDPNAPARDLSFLQAPTALGQLPTQFGQLQAQTQGRLTQQRAAGNQALENAIRATTPSPTQGKAPEGYEYDKKTGQLKKKGGGFWSTLGKIASVAAPIVAAPFTGGTSLALIGAGAGAANAALSGGGVKGALLGAGLGAMTGGFGGGATSGAAGAATRSAGSQIARGLAYNSPALLNAIRR